MPGANTLFIYLVSVAYTRYSNRRRKENRLLVIWTICREANGDEKIVVHPSCWNKNNTPKMLETRSSLHTISIIIIFNWFENFMIFNSAQTHNGRVRVVCISIKDVHVTLWRGVIKIRRMSKHMNSAPSPFGHFTITNTVLLLLFSLIENKQVIISNSSVKLIFYKNENCSMLGHNEQYNC